MKTDKDIRKIAGTEKACIPEGQTNTILHFTHILFKAL